jgi:hypothetical protein
MTHSIAIMSRLGVPGCVFLAVCASKLLHGSPAWAWQEDAVSQPVHRPGPKHCGCSRCVWVPPILKMAMHTKCMVQHTAGACMIPAVIAAVVCFFTVHGNTHIWLSGVLSASSRHRRDSASEHVRTCSVCCCLGHLQLLSMHLLVVEDTHTQWRETLSCMLVLCSANSCLIQPGDRCNQY